MGNKDRTWDENATTSTNASRDQESRDTALARTITLAVAGQSCSKRLRRHSPSLRQ